MFWSQLFRNTLLKTGIFKPTFYFSRRLRSDLRVFLWRHIRGSSCEGGRDFVLLWVTEQRRPTALRKSAPTQLALSYFTFRFCNYFLQSVSTLEVTWLKFSVHLSTQNIFVLFLFFLSPPSWRVEGKCWVGLCKFNRKKFLKIYITVREASPWEIQASNQKC